MVRHAWQPGVTSSLRPAGLPPSPLAPFAQLENSSKQICQPVNLTCLKNTLPYNLKNLVLCTPNVIFHSVLRAILKKWFPWLCIYFCCWRPFWFGLACYNNRFCLDEDEGEEEDEEEGEGPVFYITLTIEEARHLLIAI